MRVDSEAFVFARTEPDNYPPAIVHEASEQRRITYRPANALLLGYAAEDAPLFDLEGNVIANHLLPEPPINKAYVEWYGFKYTFYEENFDKELPLTLDVFKLMFECCQRIRRHGPSIEQLCILTQLLCENYVCNVHIEHEQYWYKFMYTLNETAQVYNRERRFAAWINIVRMKFKEYTFIQEGTTGGA